MIKFYSVDESVDISFEKPWRVERRIIADNSKILNSAHLFYLFHTNFSCSHRNVDQVGSMCYLLFKCNNQLH